MKILSPFGIASMLVAISLFSVFIVIFFFLYARRVEEKIVEIQVKNVINDMYEDLNTLRVPEDFTKIILNNMKNPNLTEEDLAVTENNKKVLKNAIIYSSLLLLFSGIGIFYIHSKYKIDLKILFKKSLIIILFVALTEFYFLNRIAQNYNAIDPNKIKLLILENIKDLNKD